MNEGAKKFITGVVVAAGSGYVVKKVRPAISGSVPPLAEAVILAAVGALELGRINIAARACGVARAAFEAAIAYAQERETFGVPIAKHQAIQFKLADMATKLEAARLLTASAAAKLDAGERADVEAGMAKLFASETAFELATEAMRIHGGVGYTTELPVERYYRDAPLMVIGEGTNEIQRLVIARGLLARSQRVSNERFKKETGWAPRYPSAREGWPAVVAAIENGERTDA